MGITEVQAVEVELALAGTNTSQKPLSQALDGSGKITFEYDQSQAEAVQAILRLGYDRAEGMAYSLRILVQRGPQSVTKEAE